MSCSWRQFYRRWKLLMATILQAEEAALLCSSLSFNQKWLPGKKREGHRKITVCSNYLTIQDEVNQVVIHELIHAYDECRAKNLDWTNCAHHACSEIRAGHLSGDCHFKRELLRGFIKLRGHAQECIKRRVLKSFFVATRIARK